MTKENKINAAIALDLVLEEGSDAFDLTDDDDNADEKRLHTNHATGNL